MKGNPGLVGARMTANDKIQSVSRIHRKNTYLPDHVIVTLSDEDYAEYIKRKFLEPDQRLTDLTFLDLQAQLVVEGRM